MSTEISKLSAQIGIEIRNITEYKVDEDSFIFPKEPTSPQDFLSIRFRTDYRSSSAYESNQKMAFYQIRKGRVTDLIIMNAELSRIPSAVFELKHLKKLILNSNKIFQVDPRLNDLADLEFLDLSNNKLEEWPGALNGMYHLLALDLSCNNFNTIPSSIVKLKSLTALFLSGNKIKEIPSSILQIDSLWKAHDLVFNARTQKNKFIKAQKYEEAAQARDREVKLYNSLLGGVFAFDSQIANLPPEILSKNSESIKEYWKSLEVGKHRPLNEVKIILVGEGGSGKTSLLKRLTSNTFDLNESQTHGINIKEWGIMRTNVSVKTRVWDFGGQEIMHSTHQFFLSKRSIYVIVLDSRKDEKIEYWLKHIESFGGDSPVLIVINKIDENPSYDVNRKFILSKYPNVLGFFRLSCRTEEGVEAFEKGIVKTLSNVRHLDTLWRSEWFLVKETLQKINLDFISYDNYVKICRDNDIISESEQKELISFLSDLGIMLNYHELALQDTNVLNPKWITNAVYQIINSRQISESNGLLHFSLLSSILSQDLYPVSKHNYIISLMKKFELCYDLAAEKVLIPDLLGIEEPDLDIQPLIDFYIQYSFLPKSIIPRFIVRMHNNIKEGENWRTGALLHSDRYSSRAIVKSDEEDKKIIVQVEGSQSRDFFAIIRNTLEDINSSFEKLQFEERLIIPRSNISIGYNHLLTLEQRGIEEYLPEGAYQPIHVSEVLGTVIKTQKERFEEMILQHLIDLKEKFEDKATVLEEANKIIELKPNIAGIGININALVDKIFGQKKDK